MALGDIHIQDAIVATGRSGKRDANRSDGLSPHSRAASALFQFIQASSSQGGRQFLGGRASAEDCQKG